MKFSIISTLKSPNAVLCVLALALLAQMPHAADVFRLIVKPESTEHNWQWLFSVAHSYSYAVALELAVLLFVVLNRHVESYIFAGASILINLCYYGLSSVHLFSLNAFPAWLISIVLPVAIARYSHAIVDSGATEQQPQHKRVTRTVRNTQTVEQSEQFVVPTVQTSVITDVQPEIENVQYADYRSLSDEQKRTQFALIVSGKNVPGKVKLAELFGISRGTVYAWLNTLNTSEVK